MTTYTYPIKPSLTMDFVISSLLCGISRGGGTIDATKKPRECFSASNRIEMQIFTYLYGMLPAL